MTMDYHQPYNVYHPEYYCPPYPGAGYQYSQQQLQQHQQQQQYLDHRSAVASHPKFYPNNNNNNTNNNDENRNSLAPRASVQPSVFSPMTSQHGQQQPSLHYRPGFQQSHSAGHHYTPPYLPNFLVSAGTGLTPTLTPTTLASLEQSFLDLQSSQQTRSWEAVSQSGFVPPVIDASRESTEVSQDSQDYSSEYSDSEWEPQTKRGRGLEDVKSLNLIVTSNGTLNAAPQRKYTRRNKDEKLPPEEEEKRRVRRERNKLAAAKCRQRRVDHTNILVAETEKLEAEQSQLELEIQNLQQEKEQLEFILQAHQPLCKAADLTRSTQTHKIKLEPDSKDPNLYTSSKGTSYLQPENLSSSALLTSLVTQKVPPHGKATMAATHRSHTPADQSTFSTRPTSLALVKPERSQPGQPMDTPTAGSNVTPLFCPGLDSMLDGPTGLTPLTGLSCSSQVQRNSEGGSESESTLISL